MVVGPSLAFLVLLILSVPSTATERFVNKRGTPEERSQGIDAIAKRDLRKGMTPNEVRRRLGSPESRDSYCGRAEIWTYVTSTSGTWAYIVAFVDGKLEVFGEANPQWFGYEDYNYPGAERVQEVVRAAQRGSCDKPGDPHGRSRRGKRRGLTSGYSAPGPTRPGPLRAVDETAETVRGR